MIGLSVALMISDEREVGSGSVDVERDNDPCGSTFNGVESVDDDIRARIVGCCIADASDSLTSIGEVELMDGPEGETGDIDGVDIEEEFDVGEGLCRGRRCLNRRKISPGRRRERRRLELRGAPGMVGKAAGS